MKTLTRRGLIATSASAFAASAIPGHARTPARLKAFKTRRLSAVPDDFIGLSYESQELQDPDFFSPRNRELVAKFRGLAPRGVLRLGGDTVDYAFFSTDPNAKPPERAKRDFAEGDPKPGLTWRVTEPALRNLRGFLDATGWRCLYSLNFGTSTPQIAAREARVVQDILGPCLIELHIGNQPDRFYMSIRDPKTWDVHAYLTEWLPFARAVTAAVPEAQLGLPDLSTAPGTEFSSKTAWLPAIVAALKDDPLHAHLKSLAHHYYLGGPPSDPFISIPNLLSPDPLVLRRAESISSAGRELGLVWRITEANSCFLGGKPGVSDVFAASLWMADYLLLLASLGYAGANIHGGSGEMVASSLGGLLPGERLMADPKEPHNRPFYTPIAGGPAAFTSGPTYYGMQFASAFAGLQQIALDFDAQGVNATAYGALEKKGTALIAIINKDDSRPIELGHSFALVRQLQAPALTSKTVSLTEGKAGQTLTVVPPTTAVLLRTA